MTVKERYKAFWEASHRPSSRFISAQIGIDYNHFLKWQKGHVRGPIIERKIHYFLVLNGF